MRKRPLVNTGYVAAGCLLPGASVVATRTIPADMTRLHRIETRGILTFHPFNFFWTSAGLAVERLATGLWTCEDRPGTDNDGEKTSRRYSVSSIRACKRSRDQPP